MKILSWFYSDGYMPLHFCPNPQNITPRVNPKVNYDFEWLWNVNVDSSWLKKKCTILVSGVDKGGGYVCVGAGGTWEISVPASQFFVNLKLLLKIKSLKKKKKVIILGENICKARTYKEFSKLTSKKTTQ